MNSLFVNQLTTIDFAYLCPKRGLVGETWLVDVVLSGELNDEGMVFDFGHVKKEIKSMIDNYADHTLLVPTKNQAITLTENNGTSHTERTVKLIMPSGEEIICTAPAQAILPLPVDAIAPEQVKPLLEAFIFDQLPENIAVIELTLYPETIKGAWFHYTHGLKKHHGNCQRIAHGHRSPLEIFINDQRREDLEYEQVAIWHDIYLAKQEDLVEQYQHNGHTHNFFAYTANQGDFSLALPAARCYMVETDTTIELLADHLAQVLADRKLGQTVKVIANEGFCKGAVAGRKLTVQKPLTQEP